MRGKLAGCHTGGLRHDYRMTLALLVTDKAGLLLDIGSHDEVYR